MRIFVGQTCLDYCKDCIKKPMLDWLFLAVFLTETRFVQLVRCSSFFKVHIVNIIFYYSSLSTFYSISEPFVIKDMRPNQGTAKICRPILLPFDMFILSAPIALNAIMLHLQLFPIYLQGQARLEISRIEFASPKVEK